MVKKFFTADYHFDHANIILYTNRPFYKEGDVVNVADVFPNQHTDDLIFKDDETKFRCCDWMNKTIVKNHNAKVGKDDIVYHVGDFCFKRDGTYKRFMNQLNGEVVHILGNHDYNNGCKSLIMRAVMEFGNKVALVQHVPPQMAVEIPEWCDMVICGHVHNNWKFKILPEVPEVPIINVGVDVWNYEPVSLESLLKFYHKIRLGKLSLVPVGENIYR